MADFFTYGKTTQDYGETDPIISAIKIHKQYDGLAVLKGVSLNAKRGDVVAILGSSGSGKSTLLKCLNLLEVPDAGSLRIDKESIYFGSNEKEGLSKLSKKQIIRMRLGLGMVFQHFNLWSHMTVIENVTEAPIRVLKRNKIECIAEAEELLAKVGMTDKRNYYPIHLSGGQQQRVAIARALAIKPKVLLLDEPTSSLDPELVGEVLEVIRCLAKEGTTMLVATHEIQFARNVSSNVIFLNDGAVEEEGCPRDILSNPASERLKQFLSAEH